MAGVIDDDGIQWERCNACTNWTRLQDMHYQFPGGDYPYGRDLCTACAAQQPLGTIAYTATVLTIHKPIH